MGDRAGISIRGGKGVKRNIMITVLYCPKCEEYVDTLKVAANHVRPEDKLHLERFRDVIDFKFLIYRKIRRLWYENTLKGHVSNGVACTQLPFDNKIHDKCDTSLIIHYDHDHRWNYKFDTTVTTDFYYNRIVKQCVICGWEIHKKIYTAFFEEQFEDNPNLELIYDSENELEK